MAEIHVTAMLGDRVHLGEGVRIGPGVIIEDDASIGDRCEIGAYAFIGRLTVIGADNRIGMSAHVGGEPQIVGWQPVDSRVVVGAGNIIREFATIHRGMHAGAETVIGDRCFLMGNSHIAHDCRLGDHVVVCNGALVAGHVEVGDHAFISGNCTIHQFVRLGRRTMIRGLTAVGKDVVPFTLIDQTNTVRGLNKVGLRRAGLPIAVRVEVERAYREIFRSPRPVFQSLELLESAPTVAEVAEMVAFIRASKRGICLAAPAGRRAERLPADDDEEV